MLGLSVDQWAGLARQLLPVVGGIFITLGWLTADQVGKITGVVMQVAGPASIIAGVVWSAVANKKTSIAQAVGAMPESVVTPTPTGVTVTIRDPDIAQAVITGNNSAS